MKKSIILSIIIVILAITAVAIGRLIWLQSFSNSKQGQPNSQVRQSGAAQPADASKNPAAVKVSKLMFDNPQQSSATGTEFSLKAMIDPKGEKISASELHVVFDPKMVKLESIAPSDNFSLVLANSQIDNASGTASIALGVPLGKPSIDSVSPIATFNFQTLSTNGQTKISFSDKSGAAAEGVSNNVIGSMEAATVNIR